MSGGWIDVAWRYRDARMVDDEGKSIVWHPIDGAPMDADAALLADWRGEGWTMHRHDDQTVTLCFHPRSEAPRRARQQRL